MVEGYCKKYFLAKVAFDSAQATGNRWLSGVEATVFAAAPALLRDVSRETTGRRMKEQANSFLERAKQYYELKELERLGISPDTDQRDMIWAYLSLVLKENRAAELLPDGEEDQVFLRHFCDSLQPLLLFGFKKGALVLDVGSGGGFPAVPIRILRPDIVFVLTESNRKRAAFLEEVKQELGFDNMTIHAGKAESVELGKKADYVISRGGVGTLQKFAQLAKPFLDRDGHIYTYKTKQFATELEAMTVNKDKEGIKIGEIAQYDLGGLVQGLSLVSMEFL
jgi:16S rRNA (guanine527-N7)-methyltransferase